MQWVFWFVTMTCNLATIYTDLNLLSACYVLKSTPNADMPSAAGQDL